VRQKSRSSKRREKEKNLENALHVLRAVFSMMKVGDDAATLACAAYIGEAISREEPDQQRAMARCMSFVICAGIDDDAP
jgi:hypothetical protein